jgi:hypothetical protein
MILCSLPPHFMVLVLFVSLDYYWTFILQCIVGSLKVITLKAKLITKKPHSQLILLFLIKWCHYHPSHQTLAVCYMAISQSHFTWGPPTSINTLMIVYVFIGMSICLLNLSSTYLSIVYFPSSLLFVYLSNPSKFCFLTLTQIFINS